MPFWPADHTWVYWLSASSIVMFIITLVAIPVAVVRLPRDYFIHQDEPNGKQPANLFARTAILIVRNCIGVILIVAGILMLFLPGQGLLTLLFGLSLLEFPGKTRFMHKILGRINTRPVIARMNTLRRYFKRPPFVEPQHRC